MAARSADHARGPWRHPDSKSSDDQRNADDHENLICRQHHALAGHRLINYPVRHVGRDARIDQHTAGFPHTVCQPGKFRVHGAGFVFPGRRHERCGEGAGESAQKIHQAGGRGRFFFLHARECEPGCGNKKEGHTKSHEKDGDGNPPVTRVGGEDAATEDDNAQPEHPEKHQFAWVNLPDNPAASGATMMAATPLQAVVLPAQVAV